LGNKFREYFDNTVNEEKCLAILWAVVFDHFKDMLQSLSSDGYVVKWGRYSEEERER